MTIDLFEIEHPPMTEMFKICRIVEQVYPYGKFNWRKTSPGKVMISVKLPFVLPISGVR